MFGVSKEMRLKVAQKNSEIEKLKEEIEILKKLASFSSEEIVCGISNGEIVFLNDAGYRVDVEELQALDFSKNCILLQNHLYRVEKMCIEETNYYLLTKVDLRSDVVDGVDLFLSYHQSLKNGIFEVQTSLQNILLELDHLLKQVEDSEQTNTNYRDLSHKVTDNVQNLQTKMSEIVSFITVITCKSNEILGSLLLIDEVIEQTNLLRINAAIEAARAGEYGRGFEVIANEMRRLVEKTQSITREISGAVKLIQQESSDIQANIQTTSQITDTMKSRISCLDEVATQSRMGAEHTKYRIENSKNRVFCTLAKLDHNIYKNDLYAFIFGVSRDFEQIDHTQCRLGKWYFEGEGKLKFSDTLGYQKLDPYHSDFHSSANTLVDILKKGDRSDRKVINQCMVEIEKSSTQVMYSIDEIFEEKQDSMIQIMGDETEQK